ncbi:MAG: CHASE4 domain-containing protein, partial [Pseudomonadota bacterium]
MTIRSKLVCIVIATLLFLVGLVFFLAHNFLRPNIEKVEEHLVRDHITRVRDALFQEVDRIDIFTVDWSAWDETYEFARTRTSDFVTRNLTHGELLKQQKSFIVFTDASGEIIYSQGLTLSHDGEAPVLESLLKAIASTPGLVRHPGLDSSVKGIVAVPECLVLITSRPIRTGAYKGPVAGSLIVGTYLSPTHIDELARQTHVSITIEHTAAALSGPEIPAIDYIAVKADSNDQISGRSLLVDITGKPCGILNVRVPRVLFNQYLNSMWYFMLAFIVVVLLSGGIIFLFTHQVILSPISQLVRFIEGIQSAEKISNRIVLGGRDEFLAIGTGINDMLEKLESDITRRGQTEEIV